jgi:hypothetical protein
MKKWKMFGLCGVLWYFGLSAGAWACGLLGVYYLLADWQPMARMSGR